MNISISFLSSKFSFEDTIEKINNTDAYLIHTDIMDGKYVKNQNFDKKKLKYLYNNSKKNLDVHLMVKKPQKYLKYLKNEKVKIIYFHPSQDKNHKTFKSIKKMNKKIGIVINPNEEIKLFEKYFDKVDYVLVMGVIPGMGGQEFISDTITKIKNLNQLKEEKNYNYKITIDGGVNSEVFKKLDKKILNYAVSGSFICNSDNYSEKIKQLVN